MQLDKYLIPIKTPPGLPDTVEYHISLTGDLYYDNLTDPNNGVWFKGTPFVDFSPMPDTWTPEIIDPTDSNAWPDLSAFMLRSKGWHCLPPWTPDQSLRMPDLVHSFLLSKIGQREQEHMIALYLDSTYRLLNFKILHVGTLDATYCDPKAIFKGALENNARAIILAHNHPSGDVKPSAEDLSMTLKVVNAGDLLDIPLLDHVVYSQHAHHSIRMSHSHLFKDQE